MTDQEFLAAARTLDVRIDEAALARFDRYHELIAEGNEKTNLTRITSREDVFTKHFLDSLAYLRYVRRRDRRIVDVGSGPGLPGLAFAIARPDLEVTLVESNGKKASFLEDVADVLDLKRVRVLHARAEEVGWDSADRESYDVAVARAVSRLATLAEYMLPLVRIDGRALAPKGANPGEEVDEADVATLGGMVEVVRRIKVPHLDGERHCVILRKIVSTPRNYPRRAGVPEKRPLVR